MRHLRLAHSVEVIVDSISSCGVILKPGIDFDAVIGQVQNFLDMEGLMWQ